MMQFESLTSIVNRIVRRERKLDRMGLVITTRQCKRQIGLTSVLANAGMDMGDA